MKECKRIEYLSNFQISEKCKELNINNFKGVFMRDELQKREDEEYLVIYTDHSQNVGTHWTCLFIRMELAIISILVAFPQLNK